MTLAVQPPLNSYSASAVEMDLLAAKERLEAINWGLTLLSRTVVCPLDQDATEQLRGAVGLGRFLQQEKERLERDIERLRANRDVHEINRRLPPEGGVEETKLRLQQTVDRLRA